MGWSPYRFDEPSGMTEAPGLNVTHWLIRAAYRMCSAELSAQ